MDDMFNNNVFISEEEDRAENGPESPHSTMFNDIKNIPTSSHKRSKRTMQKRVVSIPIKDVEGSRLKGESAPPSDSWAWRKYGQKPIKGSPYPRGYYRCSSSKGCPARKQVERSSLDPTMIMVTYSCDHNHSMPTSRTHHHHHHHQSATTSTITAAKHEISAAEPEPEEKFTDLNDDSLITATDEFSWFSDMSTTSLTVLESPTFAESNAGDADMAMFFPMREEDESLFADLGELPECTVVFRRGLLTSGVGPQAEIF